VLEGIEKRKGFDALADAAVIADALSAMLGKPSASIVAVILLRHGLTNLCNDDVPRVPPHGS
jgi:hypothetical protein